MLWDFLVTLKVAVEVPSLELVSAEAGTVAVTVQVPTLTAVKVPVDELLPVVKVHAPAGVPTALMLTVPPSGALAEIFALCSISKSGNPPGVKIGSFAC